jgi:hypothetical protein
VAEAARHHGRGHVDWSRPSPNDWPGLPLTAVRRCTVRIEKPGALDGRRRRL